jgi:hypothetical protein
MKILGPFLIGRFSAKLSVTSFGIPDLGFRRFKYFS